MGLEALWTVDPIVGVTQGFRGVVVLDTGRILGGDHGSVWVGHWRFENGTVPIRVKVKYYAADTISLFDRSLREVDLEGVLTPSADHKVISGNLHVVGQPNMSVALTLKRVAELP